MRLDYKMAQKQPCNGNPERCGQRSRAPPFGPRNQKEKTQQLLVLDPSPHPQEQESSD